MIIDIQRLRNLTTGILHTDIGCVYKDLESISGQLGLMPHMLPRMLEAIIPWLKENTPNQRFWDGSFDQTHEGEYDLPNPTSEDQKLMVERYFAQQNPLDGKTVVGISL